MTPCTDRPGWRAGAPRSRGYALVQFLMLVALVTLAVALAAGGRGQPGGRALGLPILCALLLAAGAWLEYRFDPYGAAVYGAVLCAGTAIILGIVVASAPPPNTVAGAGAILGAAGAAGLGLAAWRLRRAPEVAPNLLAQQFGEQAVLELDGIQFVALASPEATAAEPATIQLFLQNTWSGPRRVRFLLRTGLGRARLAVPRAPQAMLGPLEVGRLTIPLLAAPGTAPEQEVVGSLHASGLRGRRIRRWRARAATRQLPAAMRLLALAAGMLTWGGGIRFKFRVGPAAGSGAAPAPAEPRWELLWAPGRPVEDRPRTALVR